MIAKGRTWGGGKMYFGGNTQQKKVGKEKSRWPRVGRGEKGEIALLGRKKNEIYSVHEVRGKGESNKMEGRAESVFGYSHTDTIV